MILLVSAFDGELASFTERGLSIGTAGDIGEERVLPCPVGVGPLAAAAGTADALARHRARAVVFVGTAGVFPAAAARFPLDSAAVVGETTLVDLAVLRGVSERPTLLVDSFVMDDALTRSLTAGADPAGAARAWVATTSAITVDDQVARELGAAGFELENLELAAVAAACARARVPCASVLGVSNVVGSRGRAEWREHHEAAARAASSLLFSAFGA